MAQSATEGRSQKFKELQSSWAAKLLQDTVLCDAVAVVGREAKRMPCCRALVANISEPLRRAFFGEFREAATKEVVLPEVTPAAFECIVRAAAHLDPGLTPDNVAPTAQAAKMYMIEGLTEECMYFLKHHVKPDNVLTTLTSCIAHDFDLGEEIEKSMWSTILLNSAAVLRSDGFINAHFAIISRLVKLDEFAVPEELLWTRLVLWADTVKENTSLLGSLNDTLKEEAVAKRVKAEGVEASANCMALQTKILRCLIRYVRFPVMSKQFFCDEVLRFLPRKDSDEIMLLLLLGRPAPNYVASPRPGLKPVEQVQLIVVQAEHQSDEAQKLPQGTATWQINTTSVNSTHLLNVEASEPVITTRISLTFGNDRMLWPRFKVRRFVPSTNSWANEEGQHTSTGRILTCTMSASRSYATSKWLICFDCPSHVSTASSSNYAALTRVEVFGKKELHGHAADVVNRLSPELLVASSKCGDAAAGEE